ncbi:MAG TPA: manganese efflux pump MntP family protein [Clostridia bacterium]|nr:manganese efflux pump MntP family protein [Clostridia bacterium]
MSLNEVCLIGIGLSMDAVAVSMSYAMTHHKNVTKLLEMVCLFAIFQGVMPLTGYFVGGVFSEVVTRLGGYLVLFILGFIGCKMMYGGLCSGNDCPVESQVLTHKLLLLQAIATSIDALAVGVGLRAQQIEILPASIAIAATTLLLTLIAMLVGRKFGDLLGKKAEVFGGLLLVIIGIKAVL